jgi:hypothetical protein
MDRQTAREWARWVISRRSTAPGIRARAVLDFILEDTARECPAEAVEIRAEMAR